MSRMSLVAPFKRLLGRITGCVPEFGASSAPTSLRFQYDQKNDLLFARFGSPEDADNVVIEPGVAVRISRRTNQPIAIEVVDCAARFHKQPSAITSAFARELLARYGLEARGQREANARSHREALA